MMITWDFIIGLFIGCWLYTKFRHSRLERKEQRRREKEESEQLKKAAERNEMLKAWIQLKEMTESLRYSSDKEHW